MKRLKALGRRTKHNYERVLERAFGGLEPDHVPNLSRGGREGGAWPEASRATLRAAIVRHWTTRGDPERGERICARIAPGQLVVHERKIPNEEDTCRFERNVRIYDDVRARLLVLLLLGLGLRVEETLMLSRTDVKTALAAGLLKLSMTKGRKPRTLPIVKVREVLVALLAQPARQPHAIEDRTAEDQEWNSLGELLARPGSSFATQYNLMNRHVKEMGVKLPAYAWNCHLLRHIFARRLRRDGCPLSLIKLALGHAGTDGTSKVYLEERNIDTAPKALLPWLRTLKP